MLCVNNPKTQEAEAGLWVQASLDYITSSRSSKAWSALKTEEEKKIVGAAMLTPN